MLEYVFPLAVKKPMPKCQLVSLPIKNTCDNPLEVDVTRICSPTAKGFFLWRCIYAHVSH